MTTQPIDQVPEKQEQKIRNVTGYIHYNKDDDLTKIFEVLNDFRHTKGLKFSHHHDYIFFSLKSDFLNDLAKKQPFRISHYRSKSEYKCNKEVADKLTAQFDSFLRMTYQETNGTIQFLSRTTGRIHYQLVQRIFNDSKQDFDRTSYKVIQMQESFQNGNQDVNSDQDGDDGFIVVGSNKEKPKRNLTSSGSANSSASRSANSSFRGSASSSFRGSRGGSVRGSLTRKNITRENNTTLTTGISNFSTSYRDKVVVEQSTPKVRGSSKTANN